MAIHYDLTAVADANRKDEGWGQSLFFVTLAMSMFGVPSLATDKDVATITERSRAFHGITDPTGTNVDLNLAFWADYTGVKVTNAAPMSEAQFTTYLVKVLRDTRKQAAQRGGVR